jgi:hypothetical protein
MFERFRKSDRDRRAKPATAVQGSDDTAATTVSDRSGGAPRTVWRSDEATTARDRDEAAATAVHDRDEAPATAVRSRDDTAATTVRDRSDDATATTIAPPRDEPATRIVAPDDEPATRVTPRDDRLASSDRFAREPRTLAPIVGDETLVAMHDRQRIRFGGISWGSAFFGLLSAIGLAALLLGIVAAAGVAIGVSEIKDVTNGDAETIGLGGALLVLAILAVSWCCGGYVAGRMARFDGTKQGLAVWAWTVVVGVVLAIAALIGGNEYDVFARLNLPNVAVGDQTLTTGGAITLAAACVVTLVFAVLGGKLGDRFHRRVDRFAAREYVEQP